MGEKLVTGTILVLFLDDRVLSDLLIELSKTFAVLANLWFFICLWAFDLNRDFVLRFHAFFVTQFQHFFWHHFLFFLDPPEIDRVVDFRNFHQSATNDLFRIIFYIISLNHLGEDEVTETFFLEIHLKVVFLPLHYFFEAKNDDFNQILIEYIIVHNVLVHAVDDGLEKRCERFNVLWVLVFVYKNHHKIGIFWQREKDVFDKCIHISKSFIIEQSLFFFVSFRCQLWSTRLEVRFHIFFNFVPLLLNCFESRISDVYCTPIVWKQSSTKFLFKRCLLFLFCGQKKVFLL